MSNNNFNENDNSDEERIQLMGINEQNQLSVDIGENSHTAHLERHKPRIYWIDCLRVFASYIVVFQHTSFINFPRRYGDDNWKPLFFYNSFARHCVPIFIMISGLLFLSPKKVVSIKTFFSKYIYRIFISLVFWTLYYNIINEYVVNVHRANYHFTLEEIGRCLYRVVLGSNSGHLWYLYFCIGLYMLTPLYKCITEKREIAWYVAGICVVFSQAMPSIILFINTYILNINLVSELIKKLYFEMIGSNSAYYLLGYLLNTEEIENKLIIRLFYVMGIVGQILTIILRFDACYRNNREVSNFGNRNDLNVAMITVGTFMFFKHGLSDWINRIMNNNRFIRKLVLTTSECSFGIYLVHMAVYDILLTFFHFQPITFNPTFWMPIYCTIIYCITAFTVYLLRLIPFFRKVT